MGLTIWITSDPIPVLSSICPLSTFASSCWNSSSIHTTIVIEKGGIRAHRAFVHDLQLWSCLSETFPISSQQTHCSLESHPQFSTCPQHATPSVPTKRLPRAYSANYSTPPKSDWTEIPPATRHQSRTWPFRLEPQHPPTLNKFFTTY